MFMDVLSIMSKAPEQNVIFTKNAVEYVFLNSVSSEEMEKIVEHFKDKGIVDEKDIKEFLESRVREKKDNEIGGKRSDQEIEVKPQATRIIAKEYGGKVEDVWQLDVSFKGKTDVENFVKYFRNRYEEISKLLMKRRDVKNLVSLASLPSAKALNEEVTVIAMVREKNITRNGNIMLLIEDETGEVRAIIPKDVYENAYVIEDDVLAFKGKPTDNFFIIKEVIFPDIPLPTDNSIGKIKEPLNAVFISDLHFGSKNFIYSLKDKFMKWINSKDEEVSRIKYLFILGDNVDGVGIYANQEEELEITNIYDQYKAFDNFLQDIPEHIEVIVIPGNHDAVRLAEPQPALPKKYLPNSYDLENIHLVTNPSFLNIHGIDQRGINVLLYHGYAFNGVIDALENIRKEARHKPTLVMRELLKRRHLAPLYGATLLAPKEEDIHIIKDVPDIFASGDLHSHDVSNYKGTTMISASTWQAQTSFQDRVGHVANPGKITVIELDTRNINVHDFYNRQE